MRRYNVRVEATTAAWVEVEADTPEQAKREALAVATAGAIPVRRWENDGVEATEVELIEEEEVA